MQPSTVAKIAERLKLALSWAEKRHKKAKYEKIQSQSNDRYASSNLAKFWTFKAAISEHAALGRVNLGALSLLNAWGSSIFEGT